MNQIGLPSMLGLVLDTFLIAVIKIPDKSDLTEESFLLAHTQKGYSPARQGRHTRIPGSKNVWAGTFTSLHQEAESLCPSFRADHRSQSLLLANPLPAKSINTWNSSQLRTKCWHTADCRNSSHSNHSRCPQSLLVLSWFPGEPLVVRLFFLLSFFPGVFPLAFTPPHLLGWHKC